MKNCVSTACAVHVAPILETFNLGLRFFTPQRRRRRKLLEKKLIRFRSTTTLLWPISQRVRISPRSTDQKLAHAEQSTHNGSRKQDTRSLISYLLSFIRISFLQTLLDVWCVSFSFYIPFTFNKSKRS